MQSFLRLGLVPVAAAKPRAPELADLAVLPRAHADDLGVDGRGDAVVDLAVDLRQHVAVDDRRVLQVAHGRGVDDVANDEALDGLVLGDEDARRLAADALDLLSGWSGRERERKRKKRVSRGREEVEGGGRSKKSLRCDPRARKKSSSETGLAGESAVIFPQENGRIGSNRFMRVLLRVGGIEKEIPR